MSTQPPPPPFAMIGDGDAPVCVDGVCAVPEPGEPSVGADSESS